MTLDFNMNEIIRVKLTDAGYQVLVDHNTELKKELPFVKARDISFYKNLEAKSKDGYAPFQMWNFVQLFGSVSGIGLEKYMDLNIKIEVK